MLIEIKKQNFTNMHNESFTSFLKKWNFLITIYVLNNLKNMKRILNVLIPRTVF